MFLQLSIVYIFIMKSARVTGKRYRADSGAGRRCCGVDTTAHHRRAVRTDHVPGTRGSAKPELQTTVGVQLGLFADVGQRV